MAIVTDVEIPDEQIGALIRGERIGWERVEAAAATAAPRLPRDHGHLAILEGAYLHLRQFTPDVLRALDFTGGHNTQPLIAGARDSAPAERDRGSQGPRWCPYRVRAGTLDRLPGAGRPDWQHGRLPALLGAHRTPRPAGRAALWGRVRPRVSALRQPATYLATSQAWDGLRPEFCHLVGKSADAGAALIAAAADGKELVDDACAKKAVAELTRQ